jgi:hypothetical protein
MEVSTAMYGTIQGLFGLGESGDAWESFLQGWVSFTEWRELVPFVVNVTLAILLVLPFVYLRLGKTHAYELSTIEENKSLLLYSAVSAAIAVMVLEHPAMALVVFGMGGLVRFRTRTISGLAKGRAIFAVVIGLACGLGMYPLAFIMTLMGLFSARLIGPRRAVQIRVKKLDPARFGQSRETYQRLLEEAGCLVLGVNPSPANDEFFMVAVLPEGLLPEDLNDAVFGKIPKNLRGRAQVELGED